MSEAENPGRSVLAVVDAIDDLWIDAVHPATKTATAAGAFDALFGETALLENLVALGRRQREFVQTFVGPTRHIDAFEVRSGHEAASAFAERVEQSVSPFRSRILTSRESRTAWQTVDPVAVEHLEIKLRAAENEFSAALNSAFAGWREHRCWIRRSIQDEEMRGKRENASTEAKQPDKALACARWHQSREGFATATDGKALHAAARELADATDAVLLPPLPPTPGVVQLYELRRILRDVRYVGKDHGASVILANDVAPTVDALASVHVPEGKRVTYWQAIAGQPEFGLPPTPKTTLRTWCRNPRAAVDLGVNCKAKVSAQHFLVEGLIRLHAQKSPRRRPPKKPSK